MSPHPAADRIAEAALGVLVDGEQAAIEAHASECPRCSAELVSARSALASFAFARASLPPSSAGRARFFGEIEGAKRYLPFVDRVARLYDLAGDDAASLLARASSDVAWKACPFEGVQMIAVKAGPRANAVANFLARFAPGVSFPKHRHLGVEKVLVLEGAYLESNGTAVSAGDFAVSDDGSAHAFVVDAAGPCISALSIERGFELVVDDDQGT